MKIFKKIFTGTLLIFAAGTQVLPASTGLSSIPSGMKMLGRDIANDIGGDLLITLPILWTWCVLASVAEHCATPPNIELPPGMVTKDYGLTGEALIDYLLNEHGQFLAEGQTEFEIKNPAKLTGAFEKFAGTANVPKIDCSGNSENSENSEESVPAELDGDRNVAAPTSVPASDESVPASDEPVPAIVYPEPHRAFVFESELRDFSDDEYAKKVEQLLENYEKKTGRKLVPAETKKCALKIYSASGAGLETPKSLVRATRNALVKRGFAPENIYIVDLYEKNLRLAGFLKPFRRKTGDFVWENSPVIALDTNKFYDSRWFFESPLPSRELSGGRAESSEDLENERKSFLPIPLMFGVDFWISLPVVCDSQALGVSGALANVSLWNISNQRRFLDNPANAATMACYVATLPQLREKFELTILSLEKYQFIGGPQYNQNYTLSEKRLWLSANPIVLDFLMWKRLNNARHARGFDLILPEPPIFSMASRHERSLGTCIPEEITLVPVK